MPGEKLELTQEELDAKISAAVTAAVTKMEGKNTELLADLKKAKSVAKAYDGLDPDEVRQAVETANRKAQDALADKGEYEKALKLATDSHAKEISKLQGQLETANGGLKSLRSEVAIDKAMDEAGVAPAYRKAVKAMHMANISIIDKDGESVAVVGDKPVTDALKEWAGTDEGKFFVGDPGTGGGGANGGTKHSSQVNPWSGETRNLTEQGRLERDNPALANQLKREAGVSAE